MTKNQVVFGFECGSIGRRGRRPARDTTPRPSEWMTWPVTPSEPGGPSGRRLPTPKRRISIGIGRTRARSAPAALRAGGRSRGRIVVSGRATFVFV